MCCLQKIVAFEKKRWIKPALSGEDALIWGPGSMLIAKIQAIEKEYKIILRLNDQKK
jgi:hypothetical protein